MRIISFAFVLLLTVIPIRDSESQEVAPAVQVGFIYNILKFISWPDTTLGNEIIICVMGDTPVLSALKALNGKMAKGRALKLKEPKDVDKFSGCNVLYVGLSESSYMTNLLLEMQGKSVLLISSITGFAEKGGMVEFVPSGKRISLHINTKSLDKSQLVASSKLLSLAEKLY